MKFRLAYDKKGSTEFIEALCDYIENWERRISLPLIDEEKESVKDPYEIDNSKEIEVHAIEQDTIDNDAEEQVQSAESNEASNDEQVQEQSTESDEAGNDAQTQEQSTESDETGNDAQTQEQSTESDEVSNEEELQEHSTESDETSNEEAQEQSTESDETSNEEEAIAEKKIAKVPHRPDSVRKILPDEKKKKLKKKVVAVQDNLQTKKITVGTVFKRIGISMGSFVALIVVFALTLNLILIYGPSESVRNIYVNSVTETSAMKFLAYWFMDDDEVQKIIDNSKPQDDGTMTDTSIIEFPDYSASGDNETDINNIELVDVQGKTYNGKMLIIQNPKRVYLGTPEAYGKDKEGVTTIDMVKKENALYGVNGGGFFDTGAGNGGIPTGRGNSSGIVISKGKLMWGSKSNEYEIIGINKQGVLVLGKMTAKEALDSGIVEALNFGPYLIKDGEPCEISDGSHGLGGLNPRTAIGQRKDGAILLLTIDGRQASGLGASYKDLIEVMMSFDAVNAANLDGGSSTYMVQNSENSNNPKIITQCASLYGPRQVATSVLVSRVDQVNEQYE